MTKLKAGIIAAVLIAGVATPLVIQYQARVKLHEENQLLRQQADGFNALAAENQRLSNLLAQATTPTSRLPAGASPTIALPAGPKGGPFPSDDLIAAMSRGEQEAPRLSAEQVESYLNENRRNAASLLAAYRATRDAALLNEAMAKSPDDPQVAFAAVFKKDASIEERRQWLEAFKRSAPQNALPNYLSASDLFKAGQVEQAKQELNDAFGKDHFEDYSWDFIQNNEEAYRSAGYSEAEAKAIASMSLVLPHLPEMKLLSGSMIDLANSYRQAGDETSAQTVLLMCASLGQRFDGSAQEALISQLVGVAIEGNALKALDPASPYGSTGLTVQQRLDELAQERSRMLDLAARFETLVPSMTPQDWISYSDRWRLFGEQAAAEWVVSKYGAK